MLNNKLSKTTIFMHWLVATGMIGLIGSGIYMAQTKFYPMYSWHKSFGAILLVLALVRAVWRLKEGLPKPLTKTSATVHKAVSAMHWLLIATTILMPVSGMMMSVLGGHGLSVFGLEIFHHIETPSANQEQLANTGKTIHYILGYALVVLVAMHVAGAIKHHVIDKDATIKRILGK